MRDPVGNAQTDRVTAQVTSRLRRACEADATIVAGTCLAVLGYMPTDPVCNMSVDPDTAMAATHAGITYRFCSEPCRARFTADPDRYIASTHSPLGREAGSRKRSSPMPMVMVAFVAVAVILLFAAPRTGVASALPYLLLLACPFLHLLFHRGHPHDH